MHTTEITKIDKEKPTAGTLRVFDYDPSGGGCGDELFFEDNCIMEDSYGSVPYCVYVELQDGSDSGSGHESTTYSVYYEDSLVEGFINIKNPVTLDYSGTPIVPSSRYTSSLPSFDEDTIYMIEVTTTDKAGNISTNTFEIHVEGPWA